MDFNLQNGDLKKTIIIGSIGEFKLTINYSKAQIIDAFTKVIDFSDFGSIGASWLISSDAMEFIATNNEFSDPNYQWFAGGQVYNLVQKTKQALIDINGDAILEYEVLGEQLTRVFFNETKSYWKIVERNGAIRYFGDRPKLVVEDGNYNPQTGDYTNASDAYENVKKVIQNNSFFNGEWNYTVANTICSSTERVATSKKIGVLNAKLSDKASVPVKWYISCAEDAFGNATYFYYIQHLQSPFADELDCQFTRGIYLYKVEELSLNKVICTLTFNYDLKDSTEIKTFWNYNNADHDPLQQHQHILYLKNVAFENASKQKIWMVNFVTKLNRNFINDRSNFVYRELFSLQRFEPNVNGQLVWKEDIFQLNYYKPSDVEEFAKQVGIRSLANPTTGSAVGFLKSINYQAGGYTEYKYDVVKGVSRSTTIDLGQEFDQENFEVMFSSRDFMIVKLATKADSSKKIVAHVTIKFLQWVGNKFEEIVLFKDVTPHDNYNFRRFTSFCTSGIVIASPSLQSFVFLVKRFGDRFKEFNLGDYSSLGGNKINNPDHFSFEIDDKYFLIADESDKHDIRIINYDQFARVWALQKTINADFFSSHNDVAILRMKNLAILICGLQGVWKYKAPDPNWPHDPYEMNTPWFNFLMIDLDDNFKTKVQQTGVYGGKILHVLFKDSAPGSPECWTAIYAGLTFGRFKGAYSFENRITLVYSSNKGIQYDWDTAAHGFISDKPLDSWGTILELDFDNLQVNSFLGDGNIMNVNSEYYSGGRYFMIREVGQLSASFIADAQGGGAFTMSAFGCDLYSNNNTSHADRHSAYVAIGVSVLTNPIGAFKPWSEKYFTNEIPFYKDQKANIPDGVKFSEYNLIPILPIYKDQLITAFNAIVSSFSTQTSQNYLNSYWAYNIYDEDWFEIHTGFIQNVFNKVSDNPEMDAINQGFKIFSKVFGILMQVAFAILDPASIPTSVAIDCFTEIMQEIQVTLIAANSKPIIVTVDSFAMFSGGSKYLLDGNTIWYRNEDGYSISALASGEDYQITDSLSSLKIEGKVVNKPSLGGQVSSLVPFYTDAKKVYARKVQGNQVGAPSTFFYISEFNDILDAKVADGNVLYAIVGSQILTFDRNGKLLTHSTLPLTTSPITIDLEPSTMSAATFINNSNILVIIAGWKIFVYQSNAKAYDPIAGHVNLIAVLEMQGWEINNDSQNEDLMRYFSNVDSICEDFLNNTPRAILMFKNDYVGKLVFAEDFKSAHFDHLSIWKWPQYFGIKTFSQLDAIFYDYANSYVTIVKDDVYYAYNCQSTPQLVQQGQNNFFSNNLFDDSKDSILFQDQSVAILSNTDKRLFVATAVGRTYGDLSRNFVLRQINNYSGLGASTKTLTSPMSAARIFYDSAEAVHASTLPSMSFKRTIVDDDYLEFLEYQLSDWVRRFASYANAIKDRSIIEKAFANLTLPIEFTLPIDLLSIGSYAFDKTTIQADLIIGQDITEISPFTFNQTTFNGAFVVGPQVQKIGASAFFGALFNQGFQFASQVKDIDESAFANATFSYNLTLSDSVESLGNSAFEGTIFRGGLILSESLIGLPSKVFANTILPMGLILPSKITSVASDAFLNSKLRTYNEKLIDIPTFDDANQAKAWFRNMAL